MWNSNSCTRPRSSSIWGLPCHFGNYQLKLLLSRETWQHWSGLFHQGVQDPRCSTQALVFSVQTRQCQGRGEHLLLKPCPSFFDKCIKRENGVPSGFPTQQWDSSFCLHQSEHGSHPQSSLLYLFCSYLMEKIIPLGHLACNQTSEALVKNKIFLWWSP